MSVGAMVAASLIGASAQAATPKNKCPYFPANNVWHADISKMPVHSRSAAWLKSMSASKKKLHPDFGPADPEEQAVPYGIPFEETPSNRKKVSVAFDYDDESDKGPYPFAASTPIEGGSDADGDRHAIMVSSDCKLYELWHAEYGSHPSAGSGAIWDLKSNNLRKAGWTSADAAGLPILPGLLRYDEVKANKIDHAIRFTVAKSDKTYLWPARHQAGSVNDRNVPPMGARFRLKANYSTSGLRPDTVAVLNAMKKYGMIVADNGSDWFFQGTADNAWPTDLLDELKKVPGSAFEAIDESKLMVNANSGEAKKQ